MIRKLFLCFLLLIESLTCFSQDRNGYLTLDEARLISADSVVKLSLRKEKLSSVPLEITKYANLTELDLGQNKLDSLPKFIAEFKKLKRIDISRNKFVSFPVVLLGLVSLEFLVMNRNQIESFPEEIGNLTKLSEIDFWDNPIKNYPEAFIFMNLKKIHAEGIRYNATFQEKWKSLLPKTEFFFDNPCDCMD
jgi:Leucine-rich repeat (LRR) protein